MSAAPKNLSASVKARLQNEAARRGDDFNLLLLRYGIERLLFRLSQSASCSIWRDWVQPDRCGHWLRIYRIRGKLCPAISAGRHA